MTFTLVLKFVSLIGGSILEVRVLFRQMGILTERPMSSCAQDSSPAGNRKTSNQPEVPI